MTNPDKTIDELIDGFAKDGAETSREPKKTAGLTVKEMAELANRITTRRDMLNNNAGPRMGLAEIGPTERCAMEQSAKDLGCSPKDFEGYKNVVVPYRPGPDAKSYSWGPFAGNFVSYGRAVVAAVPDDIIDTVREYLGPKGNHYYLELLNPGMLSEKLAPFGYKVCELTRYYLFRDYDTNHLCPDVNYDIRLLDSDDLDAIDHAKWPHAVCDDPDRSTCMAAGAYIDGELVGIAGCTGDCDMLWQIGVDVKESFRSNNIGPTLVKYLAAQMLEEGAEPFCCAASSDFLSAKLASKCGFAPAWVELAIKSDEFAKNQN